MHTQYIIYIYTQGSAIFADNRCLVSRLSCYCPADTAGNALANEMSDSSSGARLDDISRYRRDQRPWVILSLPRTILCLVASILRNREDTEVE